MVLIVHSKLDYALLWKKMLLNSISFHVTKTQGLALYVYLQKLKVHAMKDWIPKHVLRNRFSLCMETR